MSIKYDQTYITVRQRTMLETFDIALQVGKEHFVQLALALLVGCAPWMLLNYVILYRWQSDDYQGLFFILMASLVIAQAPLATVIITDLMGAIMFRQKQRLLKSIMNCLRQFGKLFWLHGILRMAIPVTILIAIMLPDWGIEGIVSYVMFVVFGSVGTGLLVRASRPFVTEVLLLEKPDWKPPRFGEVCFANRSQSLHGPAFGTVFSQAILVALFGFLLFLSFHGLFSLRQFVTGNMDLDFWMFPIFFQLACWCVAGFMTIVRFLFYIDLRIRQEGW